MAIEVKDVVLPIVLAIITGGGAYFGTQLNAQNESRSLDIQMVQIALSILKGEARM